jgi:DNA-directed RNA polymerase subunit beta'
MLERVGRFSKIKIKIASPDVIKLQSYGEVKKPETINYRTLKPEKDGLFCERIFGTTKDYECSCGKFKTPKYEGVICDRCGVQVTESKVRRERIGHIVLAAPVAHIWYYKSSPSKIAILLNIKLKDLHSVLFHEKYIVIDPGDTDLKEKQILLEQEYIEAREKYGISFEAEMGAEAIKKLLSKIDLDDEAFYLRQKMIEKGDKCNKKLFKQLELIEDFRKSGNKPEWMILDYIPVIPPDLRPMVQLDGGRFATSDLNDLYRRLIHRNNRLKRLIKMHAPEIIIKNEKRLLQDAVDCLFDNSKRKRAIKGPSNRPLKSISELLRGKQGRFRQNLLGKRVDYSGRSVIVVGPELAIYQAGVPRIMALELFKPFIIQKLMKINGASIKNAKRSIEKGEPIVWDILEEVVHKHPVMLNRAPTLHRLGFQAFEPRLIEGKAIQLPPLVCHAYNADFDGDQMAIHIPLSYEAQIECWLLLLAAKNLLDPANGNPITWPTKDMVLGLFLLTKENKNIQKIRIKYFNNINEIYFALENKIITHQEPIKYKYKNKWIDTTAGRVIFNSILPEDYEFINEPLPEKKLKQIVFEIFKNYGTYRAAYTLDKMKELGFKYSTIFGCTISAADIIIPKEKTSIIEKTQEEVNKLNEAMRKGQITDDERYNETVRKWSDAKKKIIKKLKTLMEETGGGFNQLNIIVESGARGSITQVAQLAGMRGNMATPSGKIIDIPIKSNFKEGLTVFEYFISTHGARKGLADTALKTADAGYLTRKLIDIAQDVIISEDDCGTINGIVVEALYENEELKERLSNRITGRFSQEKLYHPITNEQILDINEYITLDKAQYIENLGIKRVKIRSVLTCESRHGICRKCYGENLATNKIVDIGEAVGIIAAQSIGQPGTQLTMRTFHIGGIASTTSSEGQIQYQDDIYLNAIKGNYVFDDDGNIIFLRDGLISINTIYKNISEECSFEIYVKDGEKVIKDTIIGKDNKGNEVYSGFVAVVKEINGNLYLISEDIVVNAKCGSKLFVKEKEILKANKTLLEFDSHNDLIVAENDGKVKFVDFIYDVNYKLTEQNQIKISQILNEKNQPKINIVDLNNEENILLSYLALPNSIVVVKDEEIIKKGQIVIKIPKGKTTQVDIVSGLPRVNNLFEARSPKNKAVLSIVEGRVKFGEIKRLKRIIYVEDELGNIHEHKISVNANLKVRDGDYVYAGQELCDGEIDPYDVLQIKGIFEFSAFLLNEIQKVYRGQGVNINDKHISIIIRQMLRKIRIEDVGDTSFVLNQLVDRDEFLEENEKIVANGGIPAKGRPALLGITKASLSIKSFISAASFQETTRVLTNAAIKGEEDPLKGLKENVIVGQKIPAGTGFRTYRFVKIFKEKEGDINLDLDKVYERKSFIDRIEKLS